MDNEVNEKMDSEVTADILSAQEEKNTKNNVADSRQKVKKLVGIGLLTAIVIVLQVAAVGIRFGIFNITLVLVPIIVGAALFGWMAGAWLGFVFGVVVLLTDAATFLAISVPGTVVTCLLKGILAGVVAGFVFVSVGKINKLLAAVAAGIAAPIVNTGVFLIGCRLFFYETIKGWGESAGFQNTALYMIVGFVGINFVVELIVNMVLSSAIVRIVNIAKKSL